VTPTRLARGILAGAVLAIAVAAPVSADPAGPTDYRSEITAVEPATPQIEASILGGDSFLQLRVEPGTEVMVVGYRGEDYVWFRPDGTVLENLNSPSRYVNEDRFGGGEIPPNATPDAEPDWEQVAEGGRWSWHDHRAHWMQETRPLGRSAGDQILEAVIPLRVDGADVDVTVISTWMPAPSPIPAWLGGLVGAALAGAAYALRRRNLPAVAAATPLAVAALVVGMWQYVSLPAETGPRALWWALPAIAVVCAMGGMFAEIRGQRFTADAALLLIGFELAVWGVVKRDGLGAAIVPTDAPGWVDRFTTAGALVGGVGFVIVALWSLFVAPARRRRVVAPTGDSPTEVTGVSGSRAPSG
jgi:hypothetical protein